jgi:cellulose biosynthesis protein BcsQ
VKLALASAKGGCTKTTSALALGFEAAQRGVEVVIVDFDPQANATARLGIPDATAAAASVHTLIQKGRSLHSVTMPTPWHENLRVVPATQDLAVLDQLTGSPDELYRLADSLAGFGDHTLVILDTAPSAGTLLYQVLLGTDVLIVPTELDLDAIDGVRQLTELAAKIALRLNSELTLGGIAVCNVPTRRAGGSDGTLRPWLNQHALLYDQLCETYGTDVLEPIVPQAQAAVLRARAAASPMGCTPGAEAVAAAYAGITDTILRLPAAHRLVPAAALNGSR